MRRLAARTPLRVRAVFALVCLALTGQQAPAAPKHVQPKHVKVDEKKSSDKRKSADKKAASQKSKTAGAKEKEKRSSSNRKSDKPDAKPKKAATAERKDDKAGNRAGGSKLRTEQIEARAAPPLVRRAPVDLLSVRSGIAESPVSPEEGSHIDYRRLDTRFAQLARTQGMVGMAVAIVERGKLTFVKGYGVTQAGGREPVTVRTVFRWASLSKTIAATMIGKLVDEGRLALSDPIDKFDTTLRLPADREKVATVEQLLSHRLGIPRNAYDDRLERGEDPRLIRRSLAGLRPVCPVGACFSYQNVAFDAVSEIVAKVTGRSYPQAVEENLFGPLGMRGASLGRPGLVDAPSWAEPTVGGRNQRVDEPYYRVPAAGGVNSTILDLGLWLRAQMGGTGTIVPRRVLDLVQAPRISTAGSGRATEYDREMRNGSYALGWRNTFYGGHRLVGHRGAVRGYRSMILFDPVAGTGVAVLWNSHSIRPVGISLEMFDMLYGRPRRDWLKLDGKEGVPAADLPVEDRND